MKMRLALLLAGGVAAAVLAGGKVFAGEDTPAAAKEKPKDAESVLQDLTLTGKVEKTQKQGKDGQTVDVYTLAVNDGEPVPLPWHKKEGSSLMNLDDYVGKEVKISAKGMIVEKDGKKKTVVKKIISVEAAGGDAAGTPPPPPAQ